MRDDAVLRRALPLGRGLGRARARAGDHNNYIYYTNRDKQGSTWYITYLYTITIESDAMASVHSKQHYIHNTSDESSHIKHTKSRM